MTSYEPYSDIDLSDDKELPFGTYGWRPSDATNVVPHFAADALCEAKVDVLGTEAWVNPMCDDAKPPVTFFVLHVGLGNCTYFVRKRFKDFDLLYDGLCKAYGKHMVPSLPPKQFLKNESAEFLRERQGQLGAFLSGLLADKVLSMSAELCSFLEAEAGAQLHRTNTAIETRNAVLIGELAVADMNAANQASHFAAQSEVHATETAKLRLALRAALADHSEASKARDTLAAEKDAVAAERDNYKYERDAAFQYAKQAKEEADAAKAERDSSKAAATKAAAAVEVAQEEVVKTLSKAREQRLTGKAMMAWAASAAEAKAAAKANKPDVGSALSNALAAALSGVSGKKEAPTEPATADEPAAKKSAVAETAAAAEAEVITAEAPAAVVAQPLTPRAVVAAEEATDVATSLAPSTAPTEHSIKSGVLLKQGAGNQRFQERYFELVQLGPRGEFGSFLVYYESELKSSVKGYISLDGATVAASQHSAEPYCLQLTTPARRLSLLTPGVAPGPLKSGLAEGGASKANVSHAQAFSCPPSLEEKMNWAQKLDNWGRHALRNAMATGPLDNPVTVWTLAATSAVEMRSWLESFGQVLSAAPQLSTPSTGGSAHAYGPISGNGATSHTPIVLRAEEVM